MDYYWCSARGKTRMLRGVLQIYREASNKMSKISDLIEQIRLPSGCSVKSPAGLSAIATPDRLPDDVREFYTLCGGVSLFPEGEYGIEIVAPDRMILANPVIAGELYEEDISSHWYIFAIVVQSDYLTIDLSAERNGPCYASFWDIHGVAGSCPIIALSFTDALQRLFENKGDYWYWFRSDFQSLGDAYDQRRASVFA